MLKLLVAAVLALVPAVTTPTPTPDPTPAPVIVTGTGTLLQAVQDGAVVATIDLCQPSSATISDLLAAHTDLAVQLQTALGTDPAAELATRRAVCVATPAPTPTPTTPAPTATPSTTATAGPTSVLVLPAVPRPPTPSSASSAIPAGSVDTGAS